MSSSGEGKRFTIGAHVDATDGRFGRLIRVIIDPVAESLTHLVVEPGHQEKRARLVPIAFVVSVEDDLIRLNCTKTQLEQLDSAEDVHFLPADATRTGYGTDASAWPFYSLRTPLGKHPDPIYDDRVPLGEVEIRRGDAVHARDGWIGAVQGLVVDPEDHHVTHFILQEGHLWGRKQVAIPIGTANRVGEEVRIDLTQEEVQALPPVSLSSRL
jgi:uncharacterized protein YrrD